MPEEEIDNEALTTLMSMGFDEQPCRHALSLCTNDVNRAVEFLFSGSAAEPEVVDMTICPTGDENEPDEWAAVKSRYAENQTIVFEECTVALEKAGGYLGQHHQHAMEEDEIRDGLASPQPGPSLQATVAFVSEYIPIMINIIAVDPGCWIGKKDYHNVQQHVLESVLRILQATVRITHLRALASDFFLLPSLQLLLSQKALWYTGSMGEAGASAHWSEVVELVAELETMRVLVGHAMVLLGRPVSDDADGALSTEERIGLDATLKQLQQLCGCIFAAHGAFSSADVEKAAEAMFLTYQIYVEKLPLPILNRALLVVTTIKPIRETVSHALRIKCLNRVIIQIQACDVPQAIATSTQEIEELLLSFEEVAPQGEVVVYRCWLILIKLLWDSPALARHLFALTLLTLIHERVEQTCNLSFDLNITHMVSVCPLTRKMLLDWIESNDIVRVLFGAKRHQQLLTNDKTKLLLQYLATHGALQKPQLEAMLLAMATAHSSEAVEITALLLQCLPHLPSSLQHTLLQSATQILPSVLLASFLTQKTSHWWCNNLHAEAGARRTLLTTLWELTVDTPIPHRSLAHPLQKQYPRRSAWSPEHYRQATDASTSATATSPLQSEPPALLLHHSAVPPYGSTGAARSMISPVRREATVVRTLRAECEAIGDQSESHSTSPRPHIADAAPAAGSAAAANLGSPASAHSLPAIGSSATAASHVHVAGARSHGPGGIGGGSRRVPQPGVPVARLCDLFSRLLDAPEQAHYLERCVQHLRHANATALPEAAAAVAPSASPYVVAQQLGHTERVLEVLSHLLPHMDMHLMESTGTPHSGDTAAEGGSGVRSVTDSSRSSQVPVPHPTGGAGDAAAATARDSAATDSSIDVAAESGAPGNGEGAPGTAGRAARVLLLYEELLQLVIAEMSAALPAARAAGLLVTHAVSKRLNFIWFLMSEWRAACATHPLEEAAVADNDSDNHKSLVRVVHLEALWELLRPCTWREREPLLEWLRLVASILLPTTRHHVFLHLLCPVFAAPEGADAGGESAGGGAVAAAGRAGWGLEATYSALLCFCHFFVVCNADCGRLDVGRTAAAAPLRVVVREVMDLEGLEGMEALWAAVLHCRSANVSRHAIAFLIHLHACHGGAAVCSSGAAVPRATAGTLQLLDTVFSLLNCGQVPSHNVLPATAEATCQRALNVIEAVLAADSRRRLPAHRDIGCGRFFHLRIVPGDGICLADPAPKGISPAPSPVALGRSPGGGGTSPALAAAPSRARVTATADNVEADSGTISGLKVYVHSRMTVWQLREAVANKVFVCTATQHDTCFDSSHRLLQEQFAEASENGAEIDHTARTLSGAAPATVPPQAQIQPGALRLERLPEGSELTGNMHTLEGAGLTAGMHVRVALVNESTGQPATSGSGVGEANDSRAAAASDPPESVVDTLATRDLSALFRLVEGGSFALMNQAWRVLQLLPTCEAWRSQLAHPAEVQWASLLPVTLAVAADGGGGSGDGGNGIDNKGSGSKGSADNTALAGAPSATAGAAVAVAEEGSEVRQLFRAVYSLQMVDAWLVPSCAGETTVTEGGGGVAGARWRTHFVVAGGFEALLRFFLELPLPLMQSAHVGEAVRAALTLCLRLLKFCLRPVLHQTRVTALQRVPAEPSGATPSDGMIATPNAEMRRLPGKLLVTLHTLHHLALAQGPDGERLEAEVMQDAIHCLDIMLQSQAVVAAAFIAQPKWHVLVLSVLYEHPASAVREGMSQMLQRYAEGHLSHHQTVIRLVVARLATPMDMRVRTCRQYFQLLQLLLASDACVEMVQSSGSGWLRVAILKLLENIRRAPARPSAEHEGCSEGLAGTLQTLLVLLRAYPQVGDHLVAEEGATICSLMLEDCLFALPDAQDMHRRAKCDTAATRNAARDLLRLTVKIECKLQQARSTEAGLHVPSTATAASDEEGRSGTGKAENAAGRAWASEMLVQVMLTLHAIHVACVAAPSWTSNPTNDPGFRNETGFCGLTNQGATCYLNSILQQLFMVPMLRSGLLSVPVPRPPEPTEAAVADSSTGASDVSTASASSDSTKPPPSRQLLWQMQRVLHFMEGSVQRFTDPRELVQACAVQLRLAHAVHLQNDAQEFVDQLLGALEAQLKGTTQDSLLRCCFGGVLSHQCFAHVPLLPPRAEDDVRTEDGGEGAAASGNVGTVAEAGAGSGSAGEEVLRRPDVLEPFLFLELTIKNKADLVESLQDFVKVEQVEGLVWEGRGAAPQSMKRTCIHTLPHCLLFNLKRYEFNLATLTRDKVNDYYRFPGEINMWPYTQEGLEAAAVVAEHSTADSSGAATLPSQWESSKYLYELKGVVVQSGTEKSGHYYSFIQDRASGRWLKFNDQTVMPFDAAHLPHECFGGTEKITVKRTDLHGQRCDVSKERAVTRSAYILIYERKAPLAAHLQARACSEPGTEPTANAAPLTCTTAETSSSAEVKLTKAAAGPVADAGDVSGVSDETRKEGGSGALDDGGRAADGELQSEGSSWGAGAEGGGGGAAAEIRALKEEVCVSNAMFLRAAQVFDLDHVDLVRDLVATVAQEAAADQEVVVATARMATAFFCKILTRFEGRSAVNLNMWLIPLRVLYTRAGLGLCLEFLDMLSADLLRAHLLDCPDATTRDAFKNLVHHVVHHVVDQLDGRLRAGPVPTAATLRCHIEHCGLAALVQALETVMRDVPAGPHALRSGQLMQLVSLMTALPWLCRYMLEADLACTLVEVFMSGTADSAIPFVGYEHLLTAVDQLVVPAMGSGPGVAPAEGASDEPAALAAGLPKHTYATVLQNERFLQRLVLRGGCPATALRLCTAASMCDAGMSVRLPAMLINGLGDAASHQSCFTVLRALLELEDATKEDRVDAVLGLRMGVLRAAREASVHSSAAAVHRCHHLFSALFQLSATPMAAAWLACHRSEWEWAVRWLEDHDTGRGAGRGSPAGGVALGSGLGGGVAAEAAAAALHGLARLRKRAYEEAGERAPEEEAGGGTGGAGVAEGSERRWDSQHGGLEDEVSRQLHAMGHANPREWAGRAVRALPAALPLSKDTLNDAVAWVLNHSQGGADTMDTDTDTDGPLTMIHAADGDLPTETIELSNNASPE